MGFKGADGAFGYVVVMDIRWENLESAVPIFKDGVTILGTGLVVECRNLMPIDSRLNRINPSINIIS